MQRHLFWSISLMLLTPTALVAADSNLAAQKEALGIIGDFADNLCKQAVQEGEKQQVELSGTAKAELNNMLKKLADLGIEGSAKFNQEEWKGPLQADIAAIIERNENCRMQIWNDLKDRLLSPPKKSESDDPKIKLIYATYFAPENDSIIETLKQNDGQRIYLDTVNADVELGDPETVIANCFPEHNVENETALDGNLNGKQIPIPISSEKDGGTCWNYFQIDSNDTRPFPISSGGTGIVNILVRKHFLVNAQYIGATTIFNLREVQ